MLNQSIATGPLPAKLARHAKPLLAATALSMFAVWGTANQASAERITCATAAKPAEFAVCNNEELQELDAVLHQLMARKVKSAATAPQQQMVKRNYNQWLLKRDSCGADFACLEIRYRDQLAGI